MNTTVHMQVPATSPVRGKRGFERARPAGIPASTDTAVASPLKRAKSANTREITFTMLHFEHGGQDQNLVSVDGDVHPLQLSQPPHHAACHQ